MRRLLFLFVVSTFMLPLVKLNIPDALAQSSAPAISQRKLQQLIELLHSNTKIESLDEKIAAALGLPHPYSRKNAVIDLDDQVQHGISVGISSPSRLLFYVRTKDRTVHMYVATLEAKLLSAVTRTADRTLMPVSVEAAQAGFDAALRVWEGAPLPK